MEKFRRQLRDESERWWHEGLIDADVYEQLAKRYEFSSIEAANSNRFITILMGLGGILLGLGAITLVAANWQEWSRTLRMVVIFSAFVGINAAGFYLWRRPAHKALQKPGLQRLGHGLLLTGALIMGANLGLMSQMFHQDGSVAGLYLVWGLGVLAMAYGLRLTSLGVLSWILILLSHREAFFGTLFWRANAADISWITALQAYLPVLITPLYLPLAHWCRSRALYGLWGVGILTMLLSASGALIHWNALSLTWTFVLIPVLLWVYHARFWRWPANQITAMGAKTSAVPSADRSLLHQKLGADGPVGVKPDPFQSISRGLAIWFLSLGAYTYSFRDFWVQYWSASELESRLSGSITNSFLLGLLGLSAIALYGCWQLFLHIRHRPEAKGLWMKTPVFGIVSTLLGLSVWCHYQNIGSGLMGPIVMNMVLFFIGFAMLHDGMLLGIRHRFWGGMGIVVIGLMTRMFEYDTGLMLKALVLALCGVAIIAAGLWFEKQTKSSIKTNAATRKNAS
ncbi:MAG: DUF2157 domain-containing protein [Cyanobacteria bacterium P01_F01_bin.53]